MAAPEQISLVHLGPFGGLDTTSSDSHFTEGDATASVNADSNRLMGGLCNAQGRKRITSYGPLPVNSTNTALALYQPLYNDPVYVACFTAAGGIVKTGVYDKLSGSTVIFTTTAWDTGVQFGYTLFLNNGLQYQGNYPLTIPDRAPAFYPWQYPIPPPVTVAGTAVINTTTTTAITNPTIGPATVSVTNGAAYPNGSFGTIIGGGNFVYFYILSGGGTNNWTIYITDYTNTVPAGSSVAGFLAAATYYYAVTRVYSLPNGITTSPDFSGYGPQETSPYGTISPYPLSYISNSLVAPGVQPATLSGTFSGTSPEGIPFTSNIYRQSTNAPNWRLLASNVTGATYTDLAADPFIAANAQLIIGRDPPPVSATNLGAIENHKERMWCFVTRQDASTLGQPQVQLWYSNVDRPWEFDATFQVLLVGESGVTNTAGGGNTLYTGYGDYPVALASMGSYLLAFKNRTMWIVVGNDQSTFQALKLADYGCQSRHSVTKGDGAVFWLSESGAFFYDGNAPTYLSSQVRNTLDTLTIADRQAAVGTFEGHTWYLSFPTAGFTLAYYTQTKKWRYLTYATTAGVSQTANPMSAFVTSGFGEVVWAELGTNDSPTTRAIDNLKAGGETDLNRAINTVWQGPLTDSGFPSWEKNYEFITLEAPNQPGVIATVSLSIDPGVPGAPAANIVTFDLGKKETRHIARLPQGTRGYLAQLMVSFSTSLTQTTPTVIYAVTAWGNPERNLVLPT